MVEGYDGQPERKEDSIMTDNKDFDEAKSQDFYRQLRTKMRDWLRKDGKDHKWAEYLMFAPDLFYTLVRLMADPEVPGKQKAKVAGAIAYFISPIDLVPEAVVGPIGYIDDIALAAYVLDDVINATNTEVVTRNWPGEADVLLVIQSIIKTASSALGKGILDKLLNSHLTPEVRREAVELLDRKNGF
jgi:uncharacterized membrane protein YkvA (DUF1232 family)